ncbi:MAG: DnaJ domain-containing protein [Planctomycetota bacterium]
MSKIVTLERSIQHDDSILAGAFQSSAESGLAIKPNSITLCWKVEQKVGLHRCGPSDLLSLDFTESYELAVSGKLTFHKKSDTRRPMMNCADFVDYYDILELDPNASDQLIDDAFRERAAELERSKEDGTADKGVFHQLVNAYKALSTPESRAEYDNLRNKWLESGNSKAEPNPVQVADAGNDEEQQRIILKIFKDQRRSNMKEPGVSPSRITELTGFSAEDVSFHLWYFFDKDWIDRDENGLLAITAIGVDQVLAAQSP